MASKYPLPGPARLPDGFGGRSAPFRQRPAGGVFTISWDLRPVAALVTRLAGETRAAYDLVKYAHRSMASDVAYKAQEALATSVRDRGRVQKYQVGMKSYDQTILKALVSDENVKADLYGWSVGYLDEIPSVSQYWRLIEFGYRGFVGRILHGSFLDGDGRRVGAAKDREAQRDPKFAQFGRLGPQMADQQFFSNYSEFVKQRGKELRKPGYAARGRFGVEIKNPIPAYHYMQRGINAWLTEEGGPFRAAMSEYREIFEHPPYGPSLDFYAKWAARYSGRPHPALVRFNNPFKAQP